MALLPAGVPGRPPEDLYAGVKKRPLRGNGRLFGGSLSFSVEGGAHRGPICLSPGQVLLSNVLGVCWMIPVPLDKV